MFAAGREGLFVREPTDAAALRGEASTHSYIAFRIALGGAMFPYASSMPGYAETLDPIERALLTDYVADLSAD